MSPAAAQNAPSIGLARYAGADGPRVGLVLDEEIAAVDCEVGLGEGVEAILRRGPDAIEELISEARESGGRVPFGDVELLAPIPRPTKVFGIGLNYKDHMAEAIAAGFDVPDVPTVFALFPTSVGGPGATVSRPEAFPQLDYEGELAVVIGRRCREVSYAEAERAIGGYMVVNDFSLRDLQTQTPQWSLSKSFDGHTPTGPWLTLSSGIDPADLSLETRVNGEVRQSAEVGNLHYDCKFLVSYLSSICTLEVGDIIATGTPAGVGVAMDPQRFLTPGDVVDVTISGLGTLQNTIVEQTTEPWSADAAADSQVGPRSAA
jgi:2-keto-4-pentenoate hydratase/2-oxohepta-3-ene-1,7-dioic acid hydratase in catechol pathway